MSSADVAWRPTPTFAEPGVALSASAQSQLDEKAVSAVCTRAHTHARARARTHAGGHVCHCDSPRSVHARWMEFASCSADGPHNGHAGFVRRARFSGKACMVRLGDGTSLSCGASKLPWCPRAHLYTHVRLLVHLRARMFAPGTPVLKCTHKAWDGSDTAFADLVHACT